jgi:hypothetical protein
LNPLAKRYNLQPDELAFYFHTGSGIDADDLGTFLKRAATVARQGGADIRVIGFKSGSLAVILKAIKKSKIAKAVKREFHKAPISTTKDATILAGSVAAAFIWAFNVEEQGVTPLSKAGVEVHTSCNVTQIDLVTVDDVYILLDEKKAETVRKREKKIRPQPDNRYHKIADDAQSGILQGAVIDVDGEWHFRPDGFRFLVPIDLSRSVGRDEIFPKAHFEVTGQLIIQNGRPDSFIVHSARQR